MKETIDASQVDEHTVVRDVLDYAVEDHALFEPGQGVCFLGGELLLENRLPRQDNVVPAPIHTDDFELELQSAERFQVLDRLDVDQGARQKGTDTDIDSQATLDPVDDPTMDDVACLVTLFDIRPDLHPLGLLLGEQDVAFRIFGALQQYLNIIANVDGQIALEIDEFR